MSVTSMPCRHVYQYTMYVRYMPRSPWLRYVRHGHAPCIVVTVATCMPHLCWIIALYCILIYLNTPDLYFYCIKILFTAIVGEAT